MTKSRSAAVVPQWIGRNITLGQACAITVFGVLAVLSSYLQPLLLGIYLREGRISTAGLGQIATIEMLATGITAILAGSLLRTTHLRWWGGGAALMLALVNLFTTHVSGTGILLSRGLAGIAEGVLLWLPMSMIARSLVPERWSGIFLTAGTVVPLCLAAILPDGVISHYGVDGAYVVIAFLDLMAVGLAFVLPDMMDALPRQSTDDNASAGWVPSLHIICVSMSIFLFMSFAGGMWAYLEPLAAQAHQSESAIGTAVSFGLAGYACGALAAIYVASRVASFPVIVVSSLLLLALASLFFTTPPQALFIASVAGFGFLTQFLVPFELLFAIEVDPSRQVAALLSGIQVLGGSAGPIMASLAVTEHDARGALGVANVCLVASLLLTVYLYVRKQRAFRFQQTGRTLIV